ncbi:MAG: deoxyguanosinetriphosphate triphosphohydrolase [Candidatus Acidiferrum sp.]
MTSALGFDKDWRKLIPADNLRELAMTRAAAGFEPMDWLDREDDMLAPYAMHARQSHGRRHSEPPHAFRTLYQRDRDRVIHSTAFRRLMHKTQVVVTQTNDHHRTRLTHTLEVAQIARTIARRLGLNEDLTVAIALSHDLGHPPFGHAGETALDECLSHQGGFEHNLHALRIVELLEYRYADFPGLNLSWEVRESIALHSKRRQDPSAAEYVAVGQPLLEAQVADAADSLAYDAHDVDDALSAGLIAPDDLQDVELWARTVEKVESSHARVAKEQLQPTVIRALIDWQVADLLEHTKARLRQELIQTTADVRACEGILVGFGPKVRSLKTGLEAFLHERVYNNHRVQRMAVKGARFVEHLFTEFSERPQLLPERYRRRLSGAATQRVVCDYVAGMTDRYAQDEYLRLFQPYSLV